MLTGLHKEFNLRKGLIYLNHAGVSPWPARTAEAVRAFADENALQGSLDYTRWLGKERELRLKLQKLLNSPSKEDIALLKNTSEALSVVAYGLKWHNGDNIVSSSREFPSNRIVWESLSDRGVEFREADLDTESSPEDALFSLVNNRTRLITISSVQYSTGLKMDLERIGEFCKKRDILFCVDAIQSLGAVSFDVQAIQADFVMADGHKWMLGPEGLAVFYSSPNARERLNLKQYGWHMVEAMGDFDRKDWEIANSARRFECGSSNMLGIHALNASLSVLLDAGMDTVEKELVERTEYLFEKIRSDTCLELTSSAQPGRYAGITCLRRSDTKSNILYAYLVKNNVVCALRSGSIRLSPHFYTPYDRLDKVIKLVLDYSP